MHLPSRVDISWLNPELFEFFKLTDKIRLRSSVRGVAEVLRGSNNWVLLRKKSCWIYIFSRAYLSLILDPRLIHLIGKPRKR